MLLEFEAMQKKAERKLKEMEKRVLFAEKQRDDALDKVKELRLQFYKTEPGWKRTGKKLETSRTNQPGL